MPTLSAEPVKRYTKIEAASDVRPLPIVEMNWATQSSAKLRRRKTAKGEGRKLTEPSD